MQGTAAGGLEVQGCTMPPYMHELEGAVGGEPWLVHGGSVMKCFFVLRALRIWDRTNR